MRNSEERKPTPPFKNHAQERIWGSVGFQPQLNHYPNCQCKSCEHAYEDLLSDDGRVILTGYDGAACKVFESKPNGVLESKAKCCCYVKKC